MRLDELPPSCWAIRRWLDPMLLQGLGDGARRHCVSDVLQRALDPAVSPTRVLECHAHDVLPNLLHDPRPALALLRYVHLAAISFLCQASNVSGVTIVPILESRRRPRILAFAAGRRR